MTRRVAIYADTGVGIFGLDCLRRFFADDRQILVSADAVRAGGFLETCDLFVMPGGADIPYCEKLNGKGTANIRDYVENGGTYLGICAGAYFGCSAIEYHKGRPDEICGTRELAFVRGAAVGSLPELAPYYDETLHSATIAGGVGPDGRECHALYNGGPTFRISGPETVKMHLRYKDLDSPALIEGAFGRGRAILSGLHMEVTAEDLLSYPPEDESEQRKAAALAAILKDKPDPHTFLRKILT